MGRNDTSKEADFSFQERRHQQLLKLLKYEHAQLKAVQDTNLQVANLANRYKSAYDQLLKSRGIQFWLGVRSLLGKKHKRYSKRIPFNAAQEPGKRAKRFLSDCPSLIKDIEEKGACSYFDIPKIRVGLIADEFNWLYLKDALEITYLNLENYQQVLDSGQLDFVLFISLWRGVKFADDDGMLESFDYYGAAGLDAAKAIISYAKKQNHTVIFQSIEDPPSFKRYLPIACLCDYIFTSSEECIDKYIEATGNENVFLGEFGINPVLHNPIGLLRKHRKGPLSKYRNTVLFAGSWYEKFKKRCEDSAIIFDGVIDSSHDLIIADRCRNDYVRDRRIFPEQYNDYIIPPLSYDDLQRAHKLFDWSVNVNSVTDSATMCARRVYEIRALGGLLLSNYSLSVSNRFPDVFMALDAPEVRRALDGYTEREVVNMQIEGVRDMFSGCTVYDRLNRMMDLAGVGGRFAPRAVYVVHPDGAEGVAEALAAFPGGSAVAVPESQAGGLAGADGLLVRWDGSGDPHYVEDLANAFKYAAPDYAFYVGEDRWREAYEYVEGEPAPARAMYDLARVGLEDALAGGAGGLRGFGVLAPRWGRDTSGSEKALAVIVPVYNNGRFLVGRCFRSLLRSSAFDRMRVYLVDDGSTDPATVGAVRQLERDYDNVVAYFFGDGGSGSASRPRNKGLELSGEPYVTYLDPDNEAVGDGFARLLKIMEERDVDFAYGKTRHPWLSSVSVKKVYYTDKDSNLNDLVLRNGAAPFSIQGSLMKRELASSLVNTPETNSKSFENIRLFYYAFSTAQTKVATRMVACNCYGNSDIALNLSHSYGWERLVEYASFWKELIEALDLRDAFLESNNKDIMLKKCINQVSKISFDEIGETAEAICRIKAILDSI